jgi:hypothetical protein
MGVLTELVPQIKKVMVCGREIEVRGIGVEAIANGLSRFPELAKLFDRRGFDYKTLLKEMPSAAGAAMAAGVGCTGDEAEERAALALPLEDQIELLSANFGLTFRSGFGPFADRFTTMMGSVPTVMRPTSSPKPSPTSLPEEASVAAK